MEEMACGLLCTREHSLEDKKPKADRTYSYGHRRRPKGLLAMTVNYGLPYPFE